MKNPKKTRNNMSRSANSILYRLTYELVAEIKTYLDEKEQLAFAESVNLSFADEEMRTIVRRDGKYLLLTIDNKSGSEYYEYEIENSGCVSVYDLIWILEQIEQEGGRNAPYYPCRFI